MHGPDETGQEQSVFSESLKRWEGPQSGTERAFQFYDRAEGELWDDYRGFVDRCYRHLPETERAQTRGQWRGGQNDQLQASWWEMLLHEYLRTGSWELDAHVESRSGPRVDFQASRRDCTFYIEAHRLGPSKEARGAQDRRNEVCAALDKARVGTWRLDLKDLTVGQDLLDPSTWVKEIEDWLSVVRPDPSELSLRHGDWHALIAPVAWEVTDHPYPRAILKYPATWGISAIGASISRALVHKVDRYEGLEPLILAIAVNSFDAEDDEITAALFGGPVCHLDEHNEVGNVSRDGDGLWISADGPRNTHVTGVVIGVESTPGDVERSLLEYWPNPWARTPLANPCPAWDVVEVDGVGVIHRTDASIGPREYFGLRHGWGTAPPFPRIQAWRAAAGETGE